MPMREDDKAGSRRGCLARGLRLLLWAAVLAVTLGIVAWQALDWAGVRAWKSVLTDLKAAGVSLEFADLADPPLADAENFAATPLLNGIGIVEAGDPDAGAHSGQRARLEEIGVAVPDGTAGPRTSMDFQSGQPPDVEAWVRLLPGVPEGGFADREAAVRAVLDHFRTRFGAELDELAEAADRPAARFVPDHHQLAGRELKIAVALPHYRPVIALAGQLGLRACAAARAGEAGEWRESVAILFRLGEAFRSDDLFLSFLASLAVDQALLTAVWEGLAAGIADDDQLAWLARELGRIELGEALLGASTYELAAGVEAIDLMQAGRLGLDGIVLDDGGRARPPASVIPSAWFLFNKSALAERYLEGLILPLREGGIDRLAARMPELEADADTWAASRNPGALVASLIVPALPTIARRGIMQQARIRMAAAACALERYRLAGRRYPESLEALVPGLLAAVPRDPIDGQPLRYRPETGGGSYSLYSLGWDRSDDGGAGNGSDSEASEPAYRGDWVWPCPTGGGR